MEVVEEVKDDLGNFINHNKHSIKMRSWTEHEISTFMKAFHEHGTKWSAVSAQVKSRTAKACASFYHSCAHIYQLHDRKANEKIPKVISSLQKHGRRENDGGAEAKENTNVSSTKKQRTDTVQRASLLSSTSSSAASHQTELFFQSLEQSCQDTIDVLTEELTAIRNLKANALNVRKQNETILRDATIAISKSILPSDQELVETSYHSFDEAIEALRKAKQALADSRLVETQMHEHMERAQVQLQSTINLHTEYQQRATTASTSAVAVAFPITTTNCATVIVVAAATRADIPAVGAAAATITTGAAGAAATTTSVVRDEDAISCATALIASVADADVAAASTVGDANVVPHATVTLAERAIAVGVAAIAAGTATDAIAFPNTTTNATGTAAAAAAMPWQQHQHSQASPSQQLQQQMVSSQPQRPLQRYMDLIQSSIRSLTPSPALALLRSLPSSDQESSPVTIHKPVAVAAAPAPVIVHPSVYVSMNDFATQLSSPISPSVIRNAVLLQNMRSIRSV